MKYTRFNLIYVLLHIQDNRDAMIFSDILLAIEKVKHKRKKSIAASTLHSYLAAIKKTLDESGISQPESDKDEEKYFNDLARHICDTYPTMVRRFYRKFTPPTFEAVVNYLKEAEILKFDQFRNIVSGVVDNLSYSLSDFLNIKQRSDYQLEGVYQTFRPSLSAQGNVLVSLARITSQKDGVLRYEELMNFRTGKTNRSQIFKGYIITKSNDILLVTTDTNIQFLQTSFLKPIMKEDIDGVPVIFRMAGSYNGFTNNVGGGDRIYSTGVVLCRELSSPFRDVDLRDVDLTTRPEYGLIPPEEIESDIRQYMYEFRVVSDLRFL